MTETDEELLTHREAAAFLKMHPATLTRLVSEGEIPRPGKIGGRLRYLKSTLIELARPEPEQDATGNNLPSEALCSSTFAGPAQSAGEE